MNFDTDGIKKRRTEKTEKRQQRLQQQKKLMIRLFAALGILAGCAILIFCVPWGMY